MKKCLILCIVCSMCLGQSLPVLQDSLMLPRFKIENLQMNLNKAGSNLTGARTTFVLSVLLSIGGTVMMLLDDDTDDNDDMVTIGIGLNLAAVVLGFFSWIQVGEAGDKLKDIKLID